MKTLPPSVQAAVMQAMESGATINEIVTQLGTMGHHRSRSAVGRYAKEYGQMASRQRDMRSMAEAFAGEFGGADNVEGKLLVQMLTSMGARMVLAKVNGDEDEEPDALEFSRLAKATKDLIGAAKTDSERDARIREEVRKEERQKASEDAVSAARAAGASDATMDAIKTKLLGLTT
ncbi:phage protein Gp27 family protein [uncultured Sphingobium sp.]|uniref:phage protein Gp27 family protein n=1 Tax=uncultured Sphingobium sp. TaxID=316087 RepID=UPI00338F1A58